MSEKACLFRFAIQDSFDAARRRKSVLDFFPTGHISAYFGGASSQRRGNKKLLYIITSWTYHSSAKATAASVEPFSLQVYFLIMNTGKRCFRATFHIMMTDYGDLFAFEIHCITLTIGHHRRHKRPSSSDYATGHRRATYSTQTTNCSQLFSRRPRG